MDSFRYWQDHYRQEIERLRRSLSDERSQGRPLPPAAAEPKPEPPPDLAPDLDEAKVKLERLSAGLDEQLSRCEKLRETIDALTGGAERLEPREALAKLEGEKAALKGALDDALRRARELESKPAPPPPAVDREALGKLEREKDALKADLQDALRRVRELEEKPLPPPPGASPEEARLREALGTLESARESSEARLKTLSEEKAALQAELEAKAAGSPTPPPPALSLEDPEAGQLRESLSKLTSWREAAEGRIQSLESEKASLQEALASALREAEELGKKLSGQPAADSDPAAPAGAGEPGSLEELAKLKGEFAQEKARLRAEIEAKKRYIEAAQHELEQARRAQSR